MSEENNDELKVDFSKYSFNFGGHYRSKNEVIPYNDLSDHAKKYVGYMAGDIGMRELFRKENIERTWPLMGIVECYDCGCRPYMEITGNTIHIQDGLKPCPYPNGYPEFFVEIDVPSGKLVFGNDFRDLVTLDTDDDSYYVNNISEQARCSQDYAKVGMVHLFVGNTCPGIWRKDDQIIIMNSAFDEESNDYVEDDSRERVGGICTDLWWFSAMDYDHYANAGGDIDDHYVNVVDVEPGRYSFSSRYHLYDRDDWSAEIIHSVGRRIGECSINEKNEVIEADTLENSRFYKAWVATKAKYGNSIFPSMTNWVEHMLCTLGGGYDWSGGVLRQSGKEDEHWVKFDDGPLDEKVRDWIGTDEYRMVPSWPIKAFEYFQNDPREKRLKFTRTFYPMSRGYCNAGKIPLNVDKYYLAVALMFFKGLYENQLLLESKSNTKVGDDRYGHVEGAPHNWGKVGIWDEESLKIENERLRLEQIRIVKDCLNTMLTIAFETNRFNEKTDFELLKAFQSLTRPTIIKEMIGHNG